MQALNLAKSDMQFKRWNSFLLACYHGGQLHRMRKVERLIEERLGEDWLNHGEAKDWGYGLIRLCMKLSPPDAVIFVMAVNKFTPTEKLLAASPEIKQEFIDGGHDRQHQGVKEGYFEVRDALCAISQSPETVCIVTQPLLRYGVFTDQPDIHTFRQAGFDGRMKMYGEGEHCVDLDLEEMLGKEKVQ